MSLLSFFGLGKSSIQEALGRGAVIIDVRTPHEFDQGHIQQSINIPVYRINDSAQRIKNMNKPVIFCCASGVRSGTAAATMKKHGLKEVYNGGSWMDVMKLLQKM